MVKCEITIDSPNRSYFAGQPLCANIKLILTETIKVKEVTVKILGRAQTDWGEFWDSTKGFNKHYSSTEDIINNTIYLIGGNGNAKPIELHQGEYDFNVVTVLPASAPATFESDTGNIVYAVKVKVNKPMAINNNFKEKFTVVRQLYNLNDDPEVKIPVEQDENSRFCYWPCQSKPVNISMKLPHTGFVPGEIIPLTVDIDNQSNTAISGTKIILIRVLMYKGTGVDRKKRINKDVQKLSETKYDHAVPRATSKTFQYHIRCPSLVPTSKHSDIIQNTYEIKYIAVTAGVHKDIKKNLPFTIGQIPLAHAHTTNEVTNHGNDGAF